MLRTEVDFTEFIYQQISKQNDFNSINCFGFI